LYVKKKYNLPNNFVFYPAQFWPHKNHVYLLEGLRELEQRHDLRIGAIFSGGDKGNRAYIEGYARELRLESRVRFAGFVSDEEIVEFYRQSVALVMPTYFGPTNLPPLEAFELGVPVLYPDKAGLREQVGDAALLIDLKNSVSMADQLKHLIENEELREQLIKNGRKRIENFNLLDRVAILRSVIEAFRWRRLCWT
jgi:glycosyltransferase involved in cell wall biosynthesis